jgi:hypothetical protein
MPAATYRRPGAEARHVRNLVFDRLPSVVRDRLTSCLVDGGAPTPLLVDASRRPPPSAGRWRALAAAAVAVEAFLWFKGFGDAGNALVLQPLGYAAAHAAAIFVLLFALIRAARLARGQGGAPFPDGRYLFALDLVEVAGQSVRVTELHTLRRVEARPGKRGPSVVLIFADAHEVVFEGQRRAEALAESVKATAFAAITMILPDDQPRMLRLDPFFEMRVSDDWASAEADAAEKRSLLLRAPLPRVAGALVAVAAIAGLGLHALRNRLSDDEMFAQAFDASGHTGDPHRLGFGDYTGTRHLDEIDALRLDRARGDIEALNEYLLHHGRRVEEAEAALFDLSRNDVRALTRAIRRGGPHAAQAEEALYELQKGDLDALVDYIDGHGPRADQADDQLFALARKPNDALSYRFYLKHGKRHVDEVQSALLPDAEYRDAAATEDAGTLGAFVREYPDSAHAAEIKAKLHATYEDALRVYRERTPSAAALRFVTALLGELEDRGDPAINLDVSVSPGPGMAAADARLGARPGADYLYAQFYLDETALSHVERDLRNDVIDTIRSSFPHGTVMPMGPGLGAATGRPLIAVFFEPIALEAFISRHDKIKLADVRYHVELRAIVPAREQELAWKLTTPGVKGFDMAVDSTSNVEREDFARESYMRMRMDGATQILERFKKDF